MGYISVQQMKLFIFFLIRDSQYLNTSKVTDNTFESTGGLALDELWFYHWVHYRKHPSSVQSAQISGPENGHVYGISQTDAMEMVPDT